ncbi:transposase [Rhodococcus sp. W8901]|uniref:transposase n=1 Tax=Rhodococcus sp. W8901 TaxID=2742603 RepID=UPI00158315E8|nr:transposase [Rhodococcus sp. W8901]QKT13506.1 transposase [Rhodococcus sp. W8901]
MPTDFVPWQTIWKRHRRYVDDGTWDTILTALLAHADANGLVDWTVSVDSTIRRAHTHGSNLARDTGDTL